MDDNYYDIPRNPAGYAILSLVCGAVGTAIIFAVPEQSMVSVILGAIGLTVGGFAINLSNRSPTDGRVKLMGLSAAGILLSVMAFMFSLTKLAG
ncbi:MAG: hypothetical protein LBJ20_06715 [Candidatus Methanoplasma sp.]|nr:hypothetical protein [Candidatus Methanoplasma sp.]